MSDLSCLGVTGRRLKGIATLPSLRQLGQQSDYRLMGLPLDSMFLGLAFSPKYNGFRLQPNPMFFSLSCKRGLKLLNSGKFIVIINIKNLIICIIINIVKIKNIIMCYKFFIYIINIINIIITKI